MNVNNEGGVPVINALEGWWIKSGDGSLYSLTIAVVGENLEDAHIYYMIYNGGSFEGETLFDWQESNKFIISADSPVEIFTVCARIGDDGVASICRDFNRPW